MTRSIPRFPSSNRRNYTTWHSPTFGPSPGAFSNTHKNKQLVPWHYRCGYSADAHGRHSGHTHRPLRDRTAGRSGGGLHERISDVTALRGARDFDRRPRRRLCDVYGLRSDACRARTFDALASSPRMRALNSTPRLRRPQSTVRETFSGQKSSRFRFPQIASSLLGISRAALLK